MRVAEVIRIALRALARHKMRSALTVLGISIGVGARQHLLLATRWRSRSV